MSAVGRALGAAALVSGLIVALPVPVGARAVVVVPFLLVCPGLSLVRLLGVGDALDQVVLGIAASMGLEAVAAEVSLLVGAWSPVAVFAVFVALTLVAVAAEGVVSRGGAQQDRAPARESSARTTAPGLLPVDNRAVLLPRLAQGSATPIACGDRAPHHGGVVVDATWPDAESILARAWDRLDRHWDEQLASITLVMRQAEPATASRPSRPADGRSPTPPGYWESDERSAPGVDRP